MVSGKFTQGSYKIFIPSVKTMVGSIFKVQISFQAQVECVVFL